MPGGQPGGRYCRVAVDSPVWGLDRPFDYLIPDRMAGRVRAGSIVRVPLHGRRVRGFVTEILERPDVPDPKPLSALVSEEPVFDEAGIGLARVIARRYLATLGQVLHHGVPGRFSAPVHPGPIAEAEVTALEAAEPAWLQDPDALRMTVSGGGSALVVPVDPRAEAEAVRYAAAHVRGSVLVLAPGPARAAELAGHLGAAVLHGEQRPADRAASWAAARDGRARLLVGSRAALMAPMPDLALVWVCGAHDRTFKEERTPRLHAVYAARERARLSGSAYVASSAAPPLELWTDPDLGRLLPRRSASRSVKPEVAGLRSDPVTTRLLSTVRWAVEQGRDAVVVITRRGLALRVRCRECGWYPKCPDCRTGLALSGSGASARLRCRGCGRDEGIPTRCGNCRGDRLDAAGWGSERLAETLAGHDLGAPVLRVDADSRLPKRRRSPAVIVGTQAAIWALHGTEVGAAVAADLDQMLGRPDFRAGERTLGLLEDMASLLGPGSRMLLQTREPEHHAVQAFTRRSYGFFADRELPSRKAAAYPPFGVVVSADTDAGDMGELRRSVTEGGGTLIGPLTRPGGRAAALIRAPELDPLLGPLAAFVAGHPTARLDVDPIDVG